MAESVVRYTAKHVLAVRKMAGVGMVEAKKALDTCDGDVLLAVGFTKSFGLAIHVKTDGLSPEEAYNRWVIRRAEDFKREYIEEYGPFDIESFTSSGISC